MKLSQEMTDKFAISLSLLCAAHCLLLPIAVVMIPSGIAMHLQNEAFHLWMVLAVIPSSIYALTIGCKAHRNFSLLFIGSLGLVLLVSALVIPHEILGEFGEKALTTLGASLIALSHFKNYRLCQKPQTRCHCPE